MNIKVIGFDADDTLWINEIYYRQMESDLYRLIEPRVSREEAEKALFKKEIGNLPLYGYGAKGFTLSMIEAAVELTGGNLPNEVVLKIIEMGKGLLTKPVVLLDNVEEVLNSLKQKYRLIMVTKGDLLDQERKLRRSGLESCFHHIEIMSDKKPDDYQKLLNHLEIAPENFLMIGNSLKSDVIPVLELGAYGIHVPCSTTWKHEMAENTHENNPKFLGTMKLKEVLRVLPD